ncbi:SusC/RagA family TonB-linked outer membrane protein [Chitinophaga parva]|uniref:SusC/RagA family TonB-linked outer membrane protein n=1 Tax=Chitinophaga parva TaxID=2169414 RepID=A0A2T7BFT5_9BACT|nr:SusC/RagA family TonB-linked outer membrane protein [Chitinophaga parva]PUZ25148.1 SusC/RagA family TonB-linked outer membrane protein [Chitinophaga parva]
MKKNLRSLPVCLAMTLLMGLSPAGLPLTATAAAQTDVKTINVSIQVKNRPLQEVMDDLTSKTGLNFHYDKTGLDLTKKVSLNCNKTPLEEVLNNLSTQTGLSFTIRNNKIIVGARTANPLNAVTLMDNAALDKVVKGNVRDAKGNTVPGVTVMIKGTAKGTQTAADGSFKIDANAGDVLVFRSVGFQTREIPVGAGDLGDVVLTENATGLNELVVTALGIKRTPKSLTYSTQRIGGEELSTVKDANIMNSLSGKAAGITVNRSSSGVGGSVKVVLRGLKSAQGSNQPLYVIDGIPITNFTTQQPNSNWGGDGSGTDYSPGRDGGDGISNLNPDDIESISVLKGASAAALYGSQAGNGVVLITTKKGKAGVSRVEISSSLTLDKATMLPALQNEYGQSEPGSTYSWGAPITNAHDNLKDFFKTGNTFVNSIGISGGNEQHQTYFSYANTHASGVMPTNDLGRHNITFRETGHFLDNKLTLEGSANAVIQKLENAPVTGLYFNPLTGLYLFPRGLDLSPYRNHFELYDSSRNIYLQNWPFNEDIQQNPYWIINRNNSQARRNRTIFSASAKYDFTSFLSLQLRGNIDRTNDTYDGQFYAGTHPVLEPSGNGRYITSNLTTTQTYGDAILTFNKALGSNFKLTALAGTAITDQFTNGFKADSYSGGLTIANKFIVQNMAKGSAYQSVPNNHNQLQSLFGSANLSFKDMIFLDASVRNDWSSNLSYTPNGSYAYPSLGLSLMLHQLFKLPAAITYAKLRGTWAQVGTSVPPYKTHLQSGLSTDGSSIAFNSTAPFTDLKPEMSHAIEVGTEWRFFSDRLSFDVTYYKTNDVNQYFQIPAPAGATYANMFVNAGNIQNQGVEVMLGYNLVSSHDFSWTTNVNFALNRNKVLSLAPSIDKFQLTSSNTYESYLVPGHSYGDIYGKILLKDSAGRVQIGSDGLPLVSADTRFVGNPNPRWTLGWNNSFSFHKFSLSFLVDGKFGGQVMSTTQGVLDKYGVSQVTADARQAGGVKINGVGPDGKPVTTIDAQKWYGVIGGRDGVSGEYMYSATTVRLRELALGYTIPRAALGNGFVKSIRVSLIGKNLIYFHKDAPYDPDITMSTANGLSGVDAFSVPAVRSFGASLNVSF